MATMNPASWSDAVTRGDEALEQGHFDEAHTVYRDLLEKYGRPDVDHGTSSWIATIVVIHRKAVAEFAGGKIDAAQNSFAEVDDHLERLVGMAEHPHEHRYLEAIWDQSRIQRNELHTGDKIRMCAVCQHGCAWITSTCPFNDKHC